MAAEPDAAATVPLPAEEEVPSGKATAAPTHEVEADDEGPMQHILQYDAQDSMVFDLKRKAIRLYGAGIIEYGNLRLDADKVSLNWAKYIIAATGKRNEAGEMEKKPVLTLDGVEYIAESVRYNYESHRAVASKLFTKQGDGLVRANKAKKDSKDTFYADRATYTTCNLPQPHFHIGASHIKVVNDDKVFSGPFWMHFDGVPTPLGFFYGLYYFPEKRTGVILPRYGGFSNEGLCIKGGGYYFNFYDYADLALTGDFYSKGTVLFTTAARYKKRYQYSGHLNYRREIRIEPDERLLPRKDKKWQLQWEHRTENNRTSSLTAKVDLQSESYRESLVKRGEGMNASLDSSVRYTNRLVGLPYTLNLNARYSKNFQTDDAKAILPDASLRTGNIYPFRLGRSRGGNPFTDIHFQHTIEFQHKVSNKVGKEVLDFTPKHWPTLLSNAQYGIKNTVPIKTNWKIGYFNLTPGTEHRYRLYWEKLDYYYDPATQKVKAREEKIKGLAQVYDCDISLGLNTTLYGTHYFGKKTPLQAIRHQMEPILNFVYTPDFSGETFGYWQRVKTKDGKEELRNRFAGSIYGGPGERAKAVLQAKLNNSLELKIRQYTDEGPTSKKIPILEGFNWSTGYDFMAKTFPLEPIRLQAWTHLFEKLISLKLNTTFDPYAWVDKGPKKERIEEYAWNHGHGLGHVTNASLSIGTQLQSGDQKSTPLDQYAQQTDDPALKEELEKLQADPTQYVDFSIPWRTSLNYEWNYASPQPSKKDIRQTLSTTSTLSITEKWQLSLQTSYDITKREFVGSATKIGIHRDLHCWQMDFGWRPLGEVQSYEFSVGVRAPVMRFVEYTRSSSYPKQ